MTVQNWLNQISLYEKTFKKWEVRTEKIIKRYKDEQRNSQANQTAKFNILWSNVQTIVPAVFARLPKPDVSRRFRDNDPIGRVAALILERSLEFEIEKYPDYKAAMKNSVLDRFLGGRGVSWVRYEPHISKKPGTPADDGVQITEDADTEASEEVQETEDLDDERAPVDYVHWKDFLHGQGRVWEENPWVGRAVYMRRAALIERFGTPGVDEMGNETPSPAERFGYRVEDIPLDTKPDEQKRGGYQDGGDYEACVYELWDKSTGKVCWVSKSMPTYLDELEDPLELEGFFPCPPPLYATLSTDSLVPVPDFSLYQDQANTLDLLCERIDRLIVALQVRGVYNAAEPALKRLFTESANTDLQPVNNWQAFAEKAGLKGAIDIVDLTPIFQALNAAYQAMEQQKAQVYEITGLSDIVRGQGDANETATAQKLKGQYASLRLRSMQSDVSHFAAGLMQLKAQIICKFFEPETIARIAAVQQFADADKPFIEQAIALLKQGSLSDFRIEVSVDSLVQIDEDAEKEAATEFVTAVGNFIKQAAEAPPEAVPLMANLLKWAATRFKVGKSIEGEIDAFADKAKAKAEQPQPDPEAQKLRAEQQAEAQRMQMEEQRQQREAQQEFALEQQRMAAEAQREERIAEREQQTAQFQAMLDQQSAASDQKFQAFMQQQEQQFQLLMQSRKDETTLQVAEMSKQTTLDAAQIGAANTAARDE